MLLIFVMVRAGASMVQAYAHIKLIYEFSTDSQKLSSAGYAVSSLEICLESLLVEQAPMQAVIEEECKEDDENSDE